ncbi:hypothetical protein [Planosporangium flavigriseum]|uniref:Uncharacterized protein n=1 Tax=Planosporangium flavigriseum TaxID=373681 RepID=A0A8J3LLT7_9ACTN|nr:hypothetical protein [Planosporangium flavigriseum]GIG73679.1 hypothetical protein Pfl04_20830 [Planosporangium flavigriseum]
MGRVRDGAPVGRRCDSNRRCRRSQSRSRCRKSARLGDLVAAEIGGLQVWRAWSVVAGAGTGRAETGLLPEAAGERSHAQIYLFGQHRKSD